MRGLFRFLVAIAGMSALAPSTQAAIFSLSGSLTADQVIDGGGSTSTATGFGVVTIDTTLFTITTDLTWSGLSGIADRSHLHDAPAGESRLDPPNGDFFHEVLNDLDRTIPCNWANAVFVDCVPATGSTHDVLQLAADDGYGYPDFVSLLNAFLRDGVYLDMHTELYPSGEIRGQLLAPIPEPATLVLLGIALACLGFSGRRKLH